MHARRSPSVPISGIGKACHLQAILLLAMALCACSARQQGWQKSIQPDAREIAPAKAISGDLLGDALRLYRSAKFEDAAEKYAEALKQNPNSADAYAGMIRCSLKEGEVQHAYQSIQKAIAAAPDSEKLHVVLGEVYFRQGKMHEAEQEFVNAANMQSPDARAYLGLARVSAAVSMRGR